MFVVPSSAGGGAMVKPRSSAIDDIASATASFPMQGKSFSHTLTVTRITLLGYSFNQCALPTKEICR